MEEMDEKLSMGAFSTTLKTRKLGLLVDTGAYDNIGGSESTWFKEHLAYLERLGMQLSIRDIPQISVSGVGYPVIFDITQMLSNFLLDLFGQKGPLVFVTASSSSDTQMLKMYRKNGRIRS